MDDSATLVLSLAFYSADLTALRNRRSELRESGVIVSRGRLLRGLLHAASEAELLTCARRLAAFYADTGRVRENAPIASRPAVELFRSDVRKLDRVKRRLAKEDLYLAANRTFIVRALLRWSPGGSALVPLFVKFKQDFPNKPRGPHVRRRRKRPDDTR